LASHLIVSKSLLVNYILESDAEDTSEWIVGSVAPVSAIKTKSEEMTEFTGLVCIAYCLKFSKRKMKKKQGKSKKALLLWIRGSN
jgi:hypothetical protein